jgi:signal transduction histidine kinase
MKKSAPTLSEIVIRRIVLFSALAMAAQFIGVLIEYLHDKNQLVQHAIERETELLYRGIKRPNGAITFVLPADLKEQYAGSSGYLARIRTGSGTELFSNCMGDCGDRLPAVGRSAPEFWISRIDSAKSLSAAGGHSFGDSPDSVVVEVAIVDDRSGVLIRVLAHEVIDHMVLPMTLMLVFVLGATSLSISKALAPVKEAAAVASCMSPSSPEIRIRTAGMPVEIAKFAHAVNAGFDALREVIGAQKVFTSAISHEVRTPLAVARLELEKIEDPRARKVEADLDGLNRLVEQLTTLARLEAENALPAETIDPQQIAEKVVMSLAPVVYDAQKTIELVTDRPTAFQGHPALIENALRNLVENAIRHTGPSAAISVAVGPGPTFCVREIPAEREEHSLGSPHVLSTPGIGLGLTIVRRIAAVDGGVFEFRKVGIGSGSTAILRFGQPH